MIRRPPFSLLIPALLLMWLLLSESASPGQWLLGLAVAILAAWIFTVLDVERPRVRFGLAMPRLAGIVLADIIRSNFAVARIIAGDRRDRGISGFLRVPIDMRNRYGLAVLAIIVTATPGTLWVQYDSTRGSLLLHVLDLVDEEAWIRLIKQRYERQLMEIFP